MTPAEFKPHCPTCSCTFAVEAAAYCSAEIVVGHETFGCLEQGPGGVHVGVHRGPIVSSPCLECGGLDHHAPVCPQSEESDSVAVAYLHAEITWDADGSVRMAPPAEWSTA